MKLFYNFLLFAVFGVLFFSCEEENEVIAPEVHEARFLDEQINWGVPEESMAMVEIPIFISHRSDRDITVEYSAQGAADAYSYVDTPGKVVIEAGRRSGLLRIMPVDNNVVNETPPEVTFTITGVSGDYSVVDTDIEGFTMKTITFIDNECLLEIPMSYTGVSAIGADAITQFDVMLTPVSGSPNTYEIASAWGPDFVADATANPDYSGQFVYSGTITIDACALSLVVESEESYAKGGTGSYDDATGTISYSLGQDLFTDPFMVDVVLTPN